MPPRESNINHMLAEIQNLGQNLTAWESEFIEHLQDKWDRTHKITPFQLEKLNEIYQNRVR